MVQRRPPAYHGSGMKIAMISAGEPGLSITRLAPGLAALGHRVDVFIRRDCQQSEDPLYRHPGVRIIRVPAGPACALTEDELPPYLEDFSDTLIAFARAEGNYDIAHAACWPSGLMALRLKETLAVPFVVALRSLSRLRLLYHGSTDGPPAARLRAEQRAVEAADALVAASPQDEEDLVRFYGADRRRIRRIACGFDPEELHRVGSAHSRRLLGLPRSGRLLLHLGRIAPHKGIDTAIKGLAWLVHQERLESRLMIVDGDSDAPDPLAAAETARLRQVAEQAGVAGRVLFMGRVNRGRLKYYYSAADMLLTTPWYETCGVTPLEAMACGRPVIATDVGSARHTVQDGRTGYLVAVNDARALARRAAHLYRHPLRRHWMGLRAAAHARPFTWARATAGFAGLYEDILARRDVNAD